MTSPARNPKDAAAFKRVPLHLIPGPSAIVTALALGDGARKYGPFNWRSIPVEASNYLAAAERHLKTWQDGEETASDSGVHHLGHAIATLMILYDALACGTLVDDRPPPAPTAKLLAEAAK